MIGVPRGKVVLSPYNPQWKQVFEEEKDHILSVAGKWIPVIEHIGSTSIEHLVAKPLIDIGIGLDNLEIGQHIIEPIKSLGYQYYGERGIAGRMYFCKRQDNVSLYHIHAYALNNCEFENHLLFRDFLRSHPKYVQEYSDLKQHLLVEYENDRPTYTLNKAQFIQKVIKLAQKSKHAQQIIQRKDASL